MNKIIVVVALLIVLSVGGAALYGRLAGGAADAPFRTAPVTRGDLLVTISATGTVEPEDLVDVGAQVAGKIEFLGKDPLADTDPKFKDKKIDYGSHVEKGTLLAQIDDAIYRAQRDAAAASLARAKADLGELIAKRKQAQAEWKRAQELHDLKQLNLSPTGLSSASGAPTTIKAISDSDYDLAEANYDIAVANVNVGDSVVLQEEAALKLAQTNMDYTVISSPVKGTIIDRRVNIGQTVVASLNAPSMFLIAKDLSRLQVWASVNEADIGHLKVGMPVHFTVDAFPKDVFRGQIAQIRLNANMTQNVVTYTVVVSAENSGMKLFPYMTADVKFEAEQLKDVLLVPNAALRWDPRPEQIAPDARKTDADKGAAEKGSSSAAPQGSSTAADASNPARGQHRHDRQAAATGSTTKGSTTKGSDAAAAAAPAAPGQPGEHKKTGAHSEKGRVWVVDGQFVRPLSVRVGPTDGTSTEVTGEGLNSGMEVVVGQARKAGTPDAGTNPFAPTIPRRRP